MSSPTHLITFTKVPAVAVAILAKLNELRPGKFTATKTFTVEEFEAAAVAEKDKVDAVFIAANLTDEEAESGKKIAKEVLPGRVKVLQFPKSVIKEGVVDQEAVLQYIFENLDA